MYSPGKKLRRINLISRYAISHRISTSIHSIHVVPCMSTSSISSMSCCQQISRPEKGYIYIRIHWSYYTQDGDTVKYVVKLGYTDNLLNRDNTYATGEYTRGKYELIFEFTNKEDAQLIEKKIIHYYKKRGYHDQDDGGTEFFCKSILDLDDEHTIHKVLDCYRHLIHKVWYSHEIPILLKKLTRKQRKRTHRSNKHAKLTRAEKIRLKQLEVNYGDSFVTPRPYGQRVLDLFYDKHYYRKEKFTLIWSCGLGKTYQSCLLAKFFGAKRICVGVPNVGLLEQFARDALRVMPRVNILYFGGTHMASKEQIQKALKKSYTSSRPVMVITTYHSSHKLVNIMTESGFRFDFTIADEAHHIAYKDTSILHMDERQQKKARRFWKFHSVPTIRTLYMTATKKVFESVESVESIESVEQQEVEQQEFRVLASMDDTETFGEIVSDLPIKWAIEQRYITDYSVGVHRHDYTQLLEISKRYGIHDIEKNQTHELFIAVLVALDTLVKYKHLNHIIVYANTTDSAEQMKHFMSHILALESYTNHPFFSQNSLFYETYHSKTTSAVRKDHIARFESATHGILFNVQLLGEGVHIPCVTCQIFAEPMFSSIRIIQSIARMLRQDPSNPSKMYQDTMPALIIPVVHESSYSDTDELSNKSYQKLVELVRIMRQYDNSIEQKIIVKHFDFHEPEYDQRDPMTFHFPEYRLADQTEKDLFDTQLIHSLSFSIADEIERRKRQYRERCLYHKTKGYQSIQEYHDGEHGSSGYIKDPVEYFTGLSIWTGWYVYLGIDTSAYPPTKDDFIHRCRELRLYTWDEYNRKWKTYGLPFDPTKYYETFQHYNDEVRVERQRRRE